MSTFSYPITAINGSIALTTPEELKIPQAIAHILQTQKEERVMRPEFGIEAQEFNLVYNLPGFLRSLEVSLVEGLAEYPGVTVRLVGFLDDSGEIPVTCYWDYDELEGAVEVIL